MRNLTNAFLTWGIGILLLAALNPLAASETRQRSMGNTGLFIYDDANLVLFPASLYRFPDRVIAELRVKNQTRTFSAGVHLPLGDVATGALYLNRDYRLPGFGNLWSGFEDMRGADFTISTRVRDNEIGLRLGAATEKRKQTTTDTLSSPFEISNTYFEVGGGLSNENFDVGAFLGIPNSYANSFTENDWNGLVFGLSGRLFLGPAEGIQYVPAVLIRQYTASVDVENQDIDTDLLIIRANLGFKYQVNENNLVVLGVELYGFSLEEIDNPLTEKTSRRITNLPAFYLGGETHAKNWLTLRLGASQLFQERKLTIRSDNSDTRETLSRVTDFNFSVGVGVYIGGFLVDLDINDNFLFEGPDFISGQGSEAVNDFIHRLSITYTFGSNGR